MKKFFTALILFSFFIFLLIFPDTVRQSACEGLTLWYSTILPVLLPFILLSNLILATDSVSCIFFPLHYAGHLFSFFQPACFYALLFGWFCGYPMGAKIIMDLYRSGKISDREGTLLLPSVNQAGPVFLTAFLSHSVLHDRYPLPLILLCFYLPPLLSFMSVLFMAKKKQFHVHEPLSSSFSVCSSSFTYSDDLILSSFHTILKIGILMMLFTIFTRLFLLLPLHSLFFRILPGFFEMSTGIVWISSLSSPAFPVRAALMLSIVSSGGLCVLAQTRSMIQDSPLSIKYYIFMKLILSLLTFFLFLFLCR